MCQDSKETRESQDQKVHSGIKAILGLQALKVTLFSAGSKMKIIRLFPVVLVLRDQANKTGKLYDNDFIIVYKIQLDFSV